MAATHVDHVVPLERGGARFDEGNLQPLCAPCHSRKTARQDGGFGREAGPGPGHAPGRGGSDLWGPGP